MGYVPLILVTDDNEVNRELIREILEDDGYRVNEAENGKEAIKQALAEIPDLILMDIEMPEMNGLEATRILMNTAETNRVPIIVLTGLNEVDDRIKAFNCGAMDFVTKPFNAHELMARVHSYLRFSLLNKKYVLSTVSQETTLPNRAAFREKLPDIDSPALFLIKIDNIEPISRFYGDSTGTGIEKHIVRFLQEKQPPEFQQYGTLFHLGRGMFGFLVKSSDRGINRHNARQLAQQLIHNFSSHQSLDKAEHYDLDFTMVICFEKENLLEKSEVALEEAIRNKTGLIMVDEVIHDIYQGIGENILWLKKVKEAVQEQRLVPFYQPIFNDRINAVDKYEALVRMIDENGNVVPPWRFLTIAKNSKYYPDITKIMIKKAMETFNNRSEDFSINLSALDIENKAIRFFILDCLNQMPGVAARLTLEIVEQEGLKFIDIMKEFVKQVKEYGVKIAIDDFGSGYSNFRTLIDLDVNYIKIDGSLIRNVHTDAATRNVVETIHSFAQKSSIAVIAEFVENQEILDCLKAMGIYYFQGYFFGKPGPL